MEKLPDRANPVGELEACRLLERVADGREDAADERTQDDQGRDHDDRDEGKQQAVLDQGLPFLVITTKLREKIADKKLNHVFRVLLSTKICVVIRTLEARIEVD